MQEITCWYDSYYTYSIMCSPTHKKSLISSNVSHKLYQYNVWNSLHIQSHVDCYFQDPARHMSSHEFKYTVSKTCLAETRKYMCSFWYVWFVYIHPCPIIECTSVNPRCCISPDIFEVRPIISLRRLCRFVNPMYDWWYWHSSF